MSEIEVKTEYRGIMEIAKRLGKSRNFVRKLITRKSDPLPAKAVGREFWITENRLQEWLNN